MRHLAWLKITLPLMLLVGATTPTYRYALEEAGSNVRAKVSFFGLSSKTAQFPRISGRIALTPDAFSIENEQLTPSLKIRRHMIRAVYGAKLDGLYGG